MKSIKIIIVTAALLPVISLAQEFLIKEPDSSAKVFKDWANQCETDPNLNQEICYTSQTIVVQGKEAELLNIAVGHVPEAEKPILRITTPLGTLLPEGMKVQIDAGEVSRLPFVFCSRVGCHIEVGVTDKFLEAIKKGNKIKLTFLDLGGRSFEVPVSLSGFTKAYNSLKS